MNTKSNTYADINLYDLDNYSEWHNVLLGMIYEHTYQNKDISLIQYEYSGIT